MEYISGNIFLREMRFLTAGDVVQGHAHNFDHTTYVAQGVVRIERLSPDGSVERAVTKRAIDGHNWILIKAGVLHRITALEAPSLCHCIYAHRTPQGDIVQEHDGWPEAYV